MKPHPALGEHPADGMFNYSLGNSVLQLVKRLHRHAAGSARMPPVELLGPLLTRDCDLLGVDL